MDESITTPSAPLIGLSLWLIPSEPVRSKLQAIIDDVANSEESPKFVPHMTVISIPTPGEIPPLKELLSPVLRKHEGLQLGFKSRYIGNSYFISVALALDQTPALLLFQKDVAEAFYPAVGVQDAGKPFFPHISLYYGERSQEERERIASFVRSKGIDGEGGQGVTVDEHKNCAAYELWVMKTEGKVEEWELLETIQ